VELQENEDLKERSKAGLAGYRDWRKERFTACTRDLAAGMEELERGAWGQHGGDKMMVQDHFIGGGQRNIKKEFTTV
jgi:hypothetical protein